MSDNAISKAVEEKVQADLKTIREEAAKKLEDRLQTVQDRLERQLKWGLSAVALMIVAGVLSSILIARSQANQAVIDLQKDIISAQSLIRDSGKELQTAAAQIRDAESKLKVSTDELNAKRSEYHSLVESLKQRSK